MELCAPFRTLGQQGQAELSAGSVTGCARRCQIAIAARRENRALPPTGRLRAPKFVLDIAWAVLYYRRIVGAERVAHLVLTIKISLQIWLMPIVLPTQLRKKL